MTILIVYEEGAGKFLAGVPLLDLVIDGDSIDEVYAKAQKAIREKLEKNTEATQKIAALNVQITRLENERRALLEQVADKYEILQPLVDEKESKTYRSILGVLEKETKIEEALKRPVLCVEFVPDEDGNIYGTKLTWNWYFNKYFKAKESTTHD